MPAEALRGALPGAPAIDHLHPRAAPGALERHGAADHSRADDDDSHDPILYAGEQAYMLARSTKPEALQKRKLIPVSNRRGAAAEVA
jgi:hypothetical protein